MRKVFMGALLFVPWTLVVPALVSIYPRQARSEKEERTSYSANLDQSFIKEDEQLGSIAFALFTLFGTVPTAMEDNGLTKKFNDFTCDEATVYIDNKNNRVLLRLTGRNIVSTTAWEKVYADRKTILKQLMEDLQELGQKAEDEGVEQVFIKGFKIPNGKKTQFEFPEMLLLPPSTPRFVPEPARPNPPPIIPRIDAPSTRSARSSFNVLK